MMQASEQPEPRRADTMVNRPDTATTVVLTMRQLGIVPLPRNYELFYEAVTTGNRELTDALSALGGRPTQKQIDEVAHRFLNRGNEHAADEARDTISTKLDEILGLLKKERNSMETYGKILGETSNGLTGRQAITREFLEKIVSVTATATRTSIESQSNIVSSITDKSQELHEVKSKLEEYKRLADTDALTQIQNRRAFDRAVSAIYESNRGIAFGALILADIDSFKTVNDRFGHPVGDRIIQIVASIIRSTVKDGTFVARTGGEEFAVILEGSGEDATHRLADEIRQAIMEAPFVNVSNGTNYGPITVSLGICMATQARGPDDLYVKADRALYASKAAGRNRVTRFSSINEGAFSKSWLLYRSK
ncbi:GGDEF domain-containing protein [Neoaquamicrobium microcysteis]|jgi:diguanylate cyclase|nr:GGDEF domain-containing protein [Mesorhizobium microcysteis]